MEDAKRLRGNNYTHDDKHLLISIVDRFKKIVENKKTDAVTWREKDKAWENITSMFNATTTNNRSKESLRKCFDNMKKQTRKTVANERMEVIKTGGGKVEMENDPNKELLLAIMNEKTTTGLRNQFDSDHDNNFIFEVIEEDEEGEPSSHDDASSEPQKSLVDWGDYKASDLKTKVSTKISNRNWNTRRRPLTAAINTSQLSEQYSNLADIKLEIAKINLEAVKYEHEFNQKERLLKLENLALEKQLKVLQIELLKKQL